MPFTKVHTKWTGPTTLAAVALLLLAVPAYAAHYLGTDSVDETWGKEIRWEDYTRYDAAKNHAHATWNALGKVNIGPDDASSTTDLTWVDYSDCETSRLAVYVGYASVGDRIRMNTCRLGAADGGATEKATAAHEFGHALGIDDHCWEAHAGQACHDLYWNQLMYFRLNNSTTPQGHDKVDYNNLHG